MAEYKGFAHLDPVTGKVVESELPTKLATRITAHGDLQVKTAFDLVGGSFSLNPNGNGGGSFVYGDNAPAIQKIQSTFLGLDTLIFEDLVTVGTGGVFIENSTDLEQLYFNELTSCIGDFIVQNCSLLTDFNAASVLNFYGDLKFLNLALNIGTLNLDDVFYIYGAATFDNVGTITTIEINSLSSIGVANNQSLSVKNNTSLTDLLSNGIIHAGGIDIENNAALPDLSFASLVDVATDFIVASNSVITSIALGSLVTVVGNFFIDNDPLLTSIGAPAFVEIGGVLHINNTGFVAFGMDDMIEIGSFVFQDNASATSFSLAALVQIDSTSDCIISGCTSLTSISMPSVDHYNGNLDFSVGNGAIDSVTIGTIGTLKKAMDINLNGQALPSANVNAILALLVSLDGTGSTTLWGAGRTLDVSGGTSGAPTGAGITDFATLTGRGATVITN